MVRGRNDNVRKVSTWPFSFSEMWPPYPWCLQHMPLYGPLVNKSPNLDSSSLCAVCWSFESPGLKQRKLYYPKDSQVRGWGPFPNLPYLIGLRDRLHNVGKGMWGLGQKLEGPWNFTQSYTPVPSSCAAWGVLAPPGLVSDKQHRCFQPAFPPVLWPASGKRAKDEIR